jgi:hypothetical protein
MGHACDAAGGQHRGQEGRDREGTVIAVIRVRKIDHLIHVRHDGARGVADCLEHAAVFVIGLALHAQGDQKDRSLYGVDGLIQDILHAGARFLEGNILTELRPGRDALEDRAHHGGRVVGNRRCGHTHTGNSYVSSINMSSPSRRTG